MQAKQTPMLTQYRSIKAQYPDALLFYRMGDFYEMFFEDAETAASILEITLTSRNKKDDVPIPMCGVPYRAVQGYISKLIHRGYKVAICDQTEDASKAKGLVSRDVVRVITPGTVVENEFLDARANNFMLAVAHVKRRIGIACLDISTGTFRVAESDDPVAVADEIRRISPSEILMSAASQIDIDLKPIQQACEGRPVSYRDDRRFDPKQGREALLEQFGTLSLEGFGCEALKAGIAAAGALLHYVGETQKQKVAHLTAIETYILDDFLTVDDLSCRNLELMANLRTGARKGALLDVIDRTMTALGGRLLRHWLRYPLRNRETILARLDAVSEAVENPTVVSEVRALLKDVADVERLGSRITMGHGNAREMVALKRSIQVLPALMAAIAPLGSDLYAFTDTLTPLTAMADTIEAAIREDAPPTINEGGLIKAGYNAELDDLIRLSSDGKGYLAELEGRERAATGINSLKVRYNKVFGYYIEIPRAHSQKAPAHYVRKQTLVNAERFITDELKQHESKVLGAEERRNELEYRLFSEIRETVRENHALIRSAGALIARLDCLTGLAHLAVENDYRRPDITADGRIIIEEGRHPVIETLIPGERFVPNSILLDGEAQQIIIITGPNMAGKSTVLRQVALITIMAQMGAFVPARFASISLTDRIFTRVGALDNLSQGQSTFMVEMQETANILHNATPESLVIMDEIGRGTSTFDGLSIAWAVAEYLHDLKARGVKTLFATHYHELTELAACKARVKNFNIAVREADDGIIFLRKLVAGGTNRSYGIQVAALAGVPAGVIERAREILKKVEAEHEGLRQLPFGEKGRSAGDPYGAEPVSDVRPPAQMGLFQAQELAVIKEIQGLDISRMTPLDALNYLNGLKERLKFL